MRARVDGFTLSGLSKYFETVGRDRPVAAANSSMVRIFCSFMLGFLACGHAANGINRFVSMRKFIF